MLVGRDRELRAMEAVLDRARAGRSSMLALVGEPGVGKTALLDEIAGRTEGMQLLRARGIESEAQIPFASLLELIRPALGLLDRIPRPQALAIEGALALRPPRAQERFAVGAATLSLLASYAEDGPVAVLVDDVQWFDGPSAQALLFAVRRLVADPIAVLVAVREGEPSLLDGADLPITRLEGLSRVAAAALVNGLDPQLTADPQLAARLHDATGGNPLGLLELARDSEELSLAPEGAPLVVSARLSRAFLRRSGTLDEPERRALLLAATCDSGDLALLRGAAQRLGITLSDLSGAERIGLVSIHAGSVEFRHPLVRSAIYADARPEERRAIHRALAMTLPDLDVDRRAWHLAAAAAGADAPASAALESAGMRARERSAHATAALAFERAGRLSPDRERRARLLFAAAQQEWYAGVVERAVALLDEARGSTDQHATMLMIDELEGHIATRQGPVMRGHAILTAAAEHADPERAIAMLAEAAGACFYAGNPTQMLAAAERARALLPDRAPVRARFLATIAIGIARVAGGDAAAGADAIQNAVALTRSSPELTEDVQMLPWLAIAPIFLRESDTGRPLLDQALAVARARSAFGVLPLMLNLIALDEATTDRWNVADATYQEAIALAREAGQLTDLVFGLSGLARLQARRGHEPECRGSAAEALALCERLGTRLHEVWAVESLGMLELGLGRVEAAAGHFEHQQRLLHELGITDPDLSPAPELIELACRRGELTQASRLVGAFSAAAEAKGQPWSMARARRGAALVADSERFAAIFEDALSQHQQTPDSFEHARTQLAYGERLRRARDRKLARRQLRAALERFETLGASPWIERAATELAATGETLRRRDPATADELTPQELQIALMLAGGSTTRETAAAMFLSPKTIEYHLRHVYLKLDIHSREQLSKALHGQARRPESASSS